MNSQASILDRAAERRSDLDFLEAKLSDDNTRLLPIWRGQPFSRANELSLLQVRQAAELVQRSSEIVWLGFYEGEACFALDVSALENPSVHAALSGSEASDLRGLVSGLRADRAELALYARAMLTWHQRHQYCGVCGQPTRPRQGGHLRVCARDECATEHFPRTDPCVLVLVRDAERCLLGRSRGWPQGMYSALAGFVEPGESLEQAATREVLEEVGVVIDHLQYVGSQAWPFPASLMMGFVANALSREIRVDGVELEAARWVSRSELAQPSSADFHVPPPGFSLSGKLIAEFVAGKL